MTWEEAVKQLREDPTKQDLVQEAYLSENLGENVARFRESPEFKETLDLLKKYSGSGYHLLDIGAGNGTSSVSLALSGYSVACIEPDPSSTVGRGAILRLKDHFSLHNLQVMDGTGERLPFADHTFDVVYTRQCLHHARDLDLFVSEASRVLRPGGIFFSLRDHVVNDRIQLQRFLNEHPLHHLYGGEQAFSLARYREAIGNAGLKVLRELGPLDSIINIAPRTKKEVAAGLREALAGKLKVNLPLPDEVVIKLAKARTRNLAGNAGRLYSFICRKR